MSLRTELEIKYATAEPAIEKFGIVRWWWEYSGPDCAPFRAYLRLHQDKIMLADITGVGDRTGRMPILLDALEDFARERHLRVCVETVVNPALHRHLVRRGYVEVLGTMDLALP